MQPLPKQHPFAGVEIFLCLCSIVVGCFVVWLLLRQLAQRLVAPFVVVRLSLTSGFFEVVKLGWPRRS